MMSSAFYIALFAALPATIAAIATLIASIRNGNKIQDVHLSLNSRLTELVEASKAQGRQDERDEQKKP